MATSIAGSVRGLLEGIPSGQSGDVISFAESLIQAGTVGAHLRVECDRSGVFSIEEGPDAIRMQIPGIGFWTMRTIAGQMAVAGTPYVDHEDDINIYGSDEFVKIGEASSGGVVLARFSNTNARAFVELKWV